MLRVTGRQDKNSRLQLNPRNPLKYRTKLKITSGQLTRETRERNANAKRETKRRNAEPHPQKQ
jgi:hypothetical protein